jgi:hypothetical protein
VRFHNGEDFTADAVKFTFDRLADTKDPMRSGPSFRQNIAEVVVQDPHTVLVKTKAPYPDLLALLHLSGPIIPPKYFQSIGKERFAREPNGTGPYRFASWKRDVQVTLQANAGYWGGKPAFGEYVYRPIRRPPRGWPPSSRGETRPRRRHSRERVTELESGRNTRVVTQPGQQIYIGLRHPQRWSPSGPARPPGAEPRRGRRGHYARRARGPAVHRLNSPCSPDDRVRRDAPALRVRSRAREAAPGPGGGYAGGST